MRTKLRLVFIAPVGADFPKGLKAAIIGPAPLMDKMVQAADQEIAVMTLTQRELTALRQYSDLFGLKLVVIRDVPGAEYSSVWVSDAAHLDTINVDQLAATIDRTLSKEDEDPTSPKGMDVDVDVSLNRDPESPNADNVSSNIRGRRQAGGSRKESEDFHEEV